jgi:hypothetical protein
MTDLHNSWGTIFLGSFSILTPDVDMLPAILACGNICGLAEIPRVYLDIAYYKTRLAP